MAVLDFTGSISDVTGAALSLVESLSAKEGFSYNSCMFTLPYSEPQQSQTATVPNKASKNPDNKPTASDTSQDTSASKGLPKTVRPLNYGANILYVEGQSLGSGSNPIIAKVGIGILPIKTSDGIICSVVLKAFEGFDTKIGDQLTIDFQWQSCAEGGILLIKGFLDPAGPESGFAHFSAHVFIGLAPEGTGSIITRPVGDIKIMGTRSNLLKAEVENQLTIKITFSRTSIA